MLYYMTQRKYINLDTKLVFSQSIVLLSSMPYVSLFSDVCTIIAQEVFDQDFSVLSKACKEIDQWPQPRPLSKLKETITLPLLGTSLRVSDSTADFNEYLFLQHNLEMLCFHTLEGANSADLAAKVEAK